MSKESIWIKTGYRIFAIEGPNGLKVEKLAKISQKNKSSFYHFFSDMEIFISKLLKQHIEQILIIAEKETDTKSINDISEILIEHKLDLLFNRQLRIYRDILHFKKCFLKTNEILMPAFLPVWKEIIGLNENSYLAQMVLLLSIENFFLQITNETLNEIWLKKYFSEIKTMVSFIQKSNSKNLLNGSV